MGHNGNIKRHIQVHNKREVHSVETTIQCSFKQGCPCLHQYVLLPNLRNYVQYDGGGKQRVEYPALWHSVNFGVDFGVDFTKAFSQTLDFPECQSQTPASELPFSALQAQSIHHFDFQGLTQLCSNGKATLIIPLWVYNTIPLHVRLLSCAYAQRGVVA